MKGSASKTALLLACGYSFREDVAEGFDPSSPLAARGTAFHDGIQQVLEGKRAPLTAAETNAALWISAQRYELGSCPGALVEPAMAWDPVSGVAVHLGTGRAAYAESPKGWLTGTADVILVGEASIVLVDWKTGETGAYKAGPQLRTLAVAAASAFGRLHVVAMSVFVDPDEGTLEQVIRLDLDELALAEHRSQLRDALERVPGAEPVLGDHCSECYCGQRGACPARAALVESATAELVQLGKRNPLTAPLDSDAAAAALLVALPHVEDFIKRRKEEATAYVEKHHGDEMRISPTHVFRKQKQQRNTIDGAAALALAKRLGASAEQELACTRTTTVEFYKRQPKKDTAA